MVGDLHALPKVRDGLSYLYVERCRIEQEEHAIALFDAAGQVDVPCANLAVLLLGPGTNVTHAAMRTLAEHGCAVVWVGEGGVRCYAVGLGKTRSARNLLRQARRWASPVERLAVVRRLYQMRFEEELGPELTLRQIRGMEGIRVRAAYAGASRETGVAWTGRSYDRGRWGGADPVNRALSAANSCLYGVCQAAIVAMGYSPGLGFIHTGKLLSFVYDMADLYKTEVTIPVAFRIAAAGEQQVETRVRRACREAFHATRLLGRIAVDIERALGEEEPSEAAEVTAGVDEDGALPGGLWDPDGTVAGGVSYSGEVEREGGRA